MPYEGQDEQETLPLLHSGSGAVCGSEGTNNLDLGPLHTQAESHCQAVIDNPDLL